MEETDEGEESVRAMEEIDEGEIGDMFQLNNHEFQWMIEDFFLYTEPDSFYCSPRFSVSSSVFYLVIYPCGQTSRNSAGWFSMYLRRDLDKEEDNDDNEEDGRLQVGACFTFGVKKMDGEIEQLGPECTWVFDEDNLCYGRTKLLSRSVMEQRQFELAPRWGTMVFSCTLLTERYFDSPGTARFDALARDFTNLLHSKKGSDVTLVVKGKEFSAHKTVLSARSSVFTAMFEADMEEKRTGRVEIDDCDPVIFREFLENLYFGKVEFGSSDPIRLYRIANKYEVPDLKSYCRISIMTRLALGTFLDTVKFGHLFDECDVMCKAKEFFKENCADITRGPGWCRFKFENAALANELLRGVTKRKRTEET